MIGRFVLTAWIIIEAILTYKLRGKDRPKVGFKSFLAFLFDIGICLLCLILW